MSRYSLGLACYASHHDQPATNLEVFVCLPSYEKLSSRIDVEYAIKFLGSDVLDVAEADYTTVGAYNIELAPHSDGRFK